MQNLHKESIKVMLKYNVIIKIIITIVIVISFTLCSMHIYEFFLHLLELFQNLKERSKFINLKKK